MFVNFFLELRQAKVPVSIKEYLALMEAMDKGVADASLSQSKACSFVTASSHRPCMEPMIAGAPCGPPKSTIERMKSFDRWRIDASGLVRDSLCFTMPAPVPTAARLRL